jgi:pimeloyl-ACP methyl ester carboxylesterase
VADANGSSITRRNMVTTAAASVAAMSGAPAVARAQSAAKTFVLVHGAWHGGWCWRRVADRLEQRGHNVFAPTLTGLGERSHLISSSVNLDTHIADIVNVIKWENLTGICLVAHSYGGWPVSGAIEQVPDRIASVVYLDAVVPGAASAGLTSRPSSVAKGRWRRSRKAKFHAPRPRRRRSRSTKRIAPGSIPS